MAYAFLLACDAGQVHREIKKKTERTNAAQETKLPHRLSDCTQPKHNGKQVSTVISKKAVT